MFQAAIIIVSVTTGYCARMFQEKMTISWKKKKTGKEAEEDKKEKKDAVIVPPGSVPSPEGT